MAFLVFTGGLWVFLCVGGAPFRFFLPLDGVERFLASSSASPSPDTSEGVQFLFSSKSPSTNSSTLHFWDLVADFPMHSQGSQVWDSLVMICGKDLVVASNCVAGPFAVTLRCFWAQMPQYNDHSSCVIRVHEKIYELTLIASMCWCGNDPTTADHLCKPGAPPKIQKTILCTWKILHQVHI